MFTDPTCADGITLDKIEEGEACTPFFLVVLNRVGPLPTLSSIDCSFADGFQQFGKTGAVLRSNSG